MSQNNSRPSRPDFNLCLRILAICSCVVDGHAFNDVDRVSTGKTMNYVGTISALGASFGRRMKCAREVLSEDRKV